MPATKSASKSQNHSTIPDTSVAGGTPFDHIVAAEKREEARVAQEVDAMHKAEEEAQQSALKKEKEAEQQLKDEAKTELKLYKEKELAPLLQKAETETENACKKLDETYRRNADAIATTLAQQFLQADSSFLA